MSRESESESMSQILADILQQVRDLHGDGWAKQRIEDLHLEEIFTPVRLVSGDEGLAMDFAQAAEEFVPRAIADALKESLLKKTAESDPLLLNSHWDSADRMFQSVICATLSALSKPFLTESTAFEHGMRLSPGRIPLSHFQEFGSGIVVIGYGGYLHEAIRAPWIEDICCADLNFAHPQRWQRYQDQMAKQCTSRPAGSIHWCDGSDSEERIARADIVCITGSALVNRTLDGLLLAAKGRPVVIVEGHSASLWPLPLLRAGATHVVQTVVDFEVVWALRRFSEQAQAGESRMTSGDYIDVLLPTKQTFSWEG